MKSIKLRVLFLVICITSLYGCASTTPTIGSKVSYGDATDVEQVTSDFGSTDLQMMAEKMAGSLGEFSAENFKQKPLVTLADVKNKTDEYIDTKSITDSIKTQLLKGHSLRLAVDVVDMQNQTDELARQNNSGLYKKATAAKVGQMKGAQYRIEGTLTSIVKKNSSVKDVYYKFTLSMTDIESGEVTWMDEKEIRKQAKR
jgi:uncharacterized protein (TIGR02722 family)